MFIEGVLDIFSDICTFSVKPKNGGRVPFLRFITSDHFCTAHIHYTIINSGCGGKEADKNWSMVIPQKAAQHAALEVP